MRKKHYHKAEKEVEKTRERERESEKTWKDTGDSASSH